MMIFIKTNENQKKIKLFDAFKILFKKNIYYCISYLNHCFCFFFLQNGFVGVDIVHVSTGQ